MVQNICYFVKIAHMQVQRSSTFQVAISHCKTAENIPVDVYAKRLNATHVVGGKLSKQIMVHHPINRQGTLRLLGWKRNNLIGQMTFDFRRKTPFKKKAR